MWYHPLTELELELESFIYYSKHTIQYNTIQYKLFYFTTSVINVKKKKKLVKTHFKQVSNTLVIRIFFFVSTVREHSSLL